MPQYQIQRPHIWMDLGCWQYLQSIIKNRAKSYIEAFTRKRSSLPLVSAEHIFESNNTGLGNRQAPFLEATTAVR